MADGSPSELLDHGSVHSGEPSESFYRGTTAKTATREARGGVEAATRFPKQVLVGVGITGSLFVSVGTGQLMGGGPPGLAIGILAGFVAFPATLTALTSRF